MHVAKSFGRSSGALALFQDVLRVENAFSHISSLSRLVVRKILIIKLKTTLELKFGYFSRRFNGLVLLKKDSKQLYVYVNMEKLC